MSFVFYDTETTGVDTKFDQILQFAAIKTDDELNEVDRFEARCRLDDHIVPSAGALRVTGMTIERITDPSLPTHYEMICQLRERLTGWCPATFVGWNSIQFDEHLLRQAFYKCLHPPYLTNTSGNQRSDILKLAQCIEAFAPGVLNVPQDERGRPTYRLDRLAPANGFPHVNAHDALADVEATIFIYRLIKQRAPLAWEQLLHCASKARVHTVLDDNAIFLLRDAYFGRLYEYALTRIGQEIGGTGSVLALDLSIEPTQLAALDDTQLKARLGRSPKPVRRIRPNAAPFVEGLRTGEPFKDLAYEVLIARAETVQQDEGLRERLISLSAREDALPSDHVEEQIYDGFPTPADSRLMERFHSVPWCDRFAIVEQFADPRYRILGRRLIYAHCPDSLPEDVRRSEARALAARLMGRSCEDPPWTTLAAADAEAELMEQEANPNHSEMLRGLRTHFADVLRRAASVLEP